MRRPTRQAGGPQVLGTTRWPLPSSLCAWQLSASPPGCAMRTCRAAGMGCPKLPNLGVLVSRAATHHLPSLTPHPTSSPGCSEAEEEDCPCIVCGERDVEERTMLECDRCLAGCHLACLAPPLDEVPEV